MSCCSIFTLLIIFTVTNADGVTQAPPKTVHLMRSQTHKHTQNSLSLWRVCTVHLHIHFSLTLVLSLSLIFSDRLILNCYHIWFNYSTSALNLLHLSLSLCSTFLFALFSSWTLKSLWSTVSLSFSFSHHLACCSPSNIQAPPAQISLTISFSAVTASLILSLSLSLSLICSESVIYTATTHAE